jgi:hypothetical protein
MNNNRSIELSPILAKVLLPKNVEKTQSNTTKYLWWIEQEYLIKKGNNTSYFLQGVASIYENLNIKKHKVISTKNRARELREGEDKQITSNKHKRHRWFVYRGSVHQEPNPVEESTKDWAFSTLSLSPMVTKTGKCSFSFVNKRPKSPQGQPQR